MLFNSDIYIYLFLPIVIIVYFLISICKLRIIATGWLIFASFVFYGFWNISYVPLLLFSIGFNYLLGYHLSLPRTKLSNKQFLLAVGILGNITLLGIFKYADFVVNNLNWFLDVNLSLLNLLLPLAISFFTFQQIAFLVDCYKGLAHERDLINYTLFVSFFPQLIAGPIVHHKEMLPQFSNKKNFIFNHENISVGLFIFFLGLTKKVGIADTFAVWANTGFSYDSTLTFFDAWVTSLAYTLQLYFDFSGYTDMAIGSALLLNIRLPINFNSPYKATSIQDFWRRWHMTLSRFWKDYVYIPMGGNKRGLARTVIALFTVFLIGGLWHGAAWTFVLWGAFHGIAVIVHRFWSLFVPVKLPMLLSWFLTFNFINVTWVFFRSETVESALTILRSMFSFETISMKSILFDSTLPFSFLHKIPFSELAFLPITGGIVLGMIIVLFCKNSNQLCNSFTPKIAYLIATIILYFTGVLMMSGYSEFLYFNF